jgi:hypothetical protein
LPAKVDVNVIETVKLSQFASSDIGLEPVCCATGVTVHWLFDKDPELEEFTVSGDPRT